MTNPCIELIHSHRSVRRYKPDPISQEIIHAIIEAGQRASTSSNLQLYSVIAVTDKSRRARLAELCGDQPHIAQAPLFLAWCADLSRSDRVCVLRNCTQVTSYIENFLVAALDAAIAAQTAALAAESLGLGICYIGAIRNRPREIIELLEMPKLTFPVTGMTVGWPAGMPASKPRLPLDAVLHWESYDRTHEDRALAEYDQTMINSGIYQGREAPVPGAAGAAPAGFTQEQYGWLEHSARRVSQPARTDLREALEKQGFALK